MPSQRSRRPSVLLLFVALLVGSVSTPGLVAGSGNVSQGRPNDHVLTPVGQAIDLAPTLSSDGTFRGSADLAGMIDTNAWPLVSDLATGEPPRFAAIGPAVVTPVGPWSALGSNGAGNGALNNAVYSIAVSGSNVYVGGSFTNAAGIAEADYVAKWNGSAWSALGSNGFGEGALFGIVDAIAISGSNVYVGGSFTNAAGLAAADYIAMWNGSSWSAVGSNGAGNGALNSNVNALAVSGAAVYAAGQFVNAAGIAEADFVAKWNGSTWSALGSGGVGTGALTQAAWALAVSGGNLYVGGIFINVAGIPEADYVAMWNASSWSALGSNGTGNGAINAYVTSLAVSVSDLYVGGWFTDAAGISSADHVAKWNESTWEPLGSNGAGNGALANSAIAVAVYGTNVYVYGVSGNIAGIAEADYVALWNGSAWYALGSNGAGNGALFNPTGIGALAISSTDLYVGGSFSNVAGIAAADYAADWGLSPFTDIGNSTFKKDIVWLYLSGITSGCSPTLYCPLASVTRGQMAAFLSRALNLPNTATDYFTDDNGTTFENNINRVAEAGITTGCTATTFCPTANVTRGQMAAFLSRALSLPNTATDYFTDDNGTTFENNINRLAAAGLTTGCTATTFCPTADVTRGQMAAFLHRAFGP
jgi:hypothetical protein